MYQDILEFLFEQQITPRKALEAIHERVAGDEPLLPNKTVSSAASEPSNDFRERVIADLRKNRVIVDDQRAASEPMSAREFYSGTEYAFPFATDDERVSEVFEFAEDYLDYRETPLLSKIAELKATFNIRWQADMRAIKQWQRAHPGNDLVWPDHADLVVWLTEGYADLVATNCKMSRELATLKHDLEDARMDAEHLRQRKADYKARALRAEAAEAELIAENVELRQQSKSEAELNALKTYLSEHGIGDEYETVMDKVKRAIGERDDAEERIATLPGGCGRPGRKDRISPA